MPKQVINDPCSQSIDIVGLWNISLDCFNEKYTSLTPPSNNIRKNRGIKTRSISLIKQRTGFFFYCEEEKTYSYEIVLAHLLNILILLMSHLLQKIHWQMNPTRDYHIPKRKFFHRNFHIELYLFTSVLIDKRLFKS